mgnify:FL=1
MKWLNFLLLFLCSFSINAQVNIPIRVLEYNGREAKTPLKNVEIMIVGAGSTVTDENGKCTIHMITAHAGDKVIVRRIAKEGYEIFNEDVIENWHVSKDESVFTIVMCSSERIKQIRENYKRVISKTNEEKYTEEEKQIQANYQNNFISKKEYEEKKKQLKKEYEKKLDDISYYIDRLSRIDLNDISSNEQKIIEYIQNGEIEKAIDSYDCLNLLSQYKSIVGDVSKLNNVLEKTDNVLKSSKDNIDSIYSSVLREVNFLQMVGGAENYKKCTQLLREFALIDTTYYKPSFNYAIYSDRQNNFVDAEKFYSIALNNCAKDDLETLAKLNKNIGDHYRRLEKYDEAKIHLQKANDLFEKLNKNTNAFIIELVEIKIFQGVIHCRLFEYEKAEAAYLSGLEIVQPLYEIDSIEYCDLKTMFHINLGNNYLKMERFKESNQEYDKALKLLDPASKDNYKTLMQTSGLRINMAYGCMKQKQFDFGHKCIDQAIEDIKIANSINPDAMLGYYEEAQLARAYLLREEGKKEKSKELLDWIISSITKISENYPHALDTVLNEAKEVLSTVTDSK